MQNIKKILNDQIIAGRLLEEIKINERFTSHSWKLIDLPQKETAGKNRLEGIQLVSANFKQTEGSYAKNSYLSTHYPYSEEILSLFESLCCGPVVNAAFIRLTQGDALLPHKDNDCFLPDSDFHFHHDHYHFMVRGKIELSVETEVFTVVTGDFIFFKNELLHSFKNLETSDSLILVLDVRTPEKYRN
jgi:hypothetical protein